MKINYDSFKSFNRFNQDIEISLAKPNKQIIGRLTEAFNIKQILKLGQLNEITFSIPYQVEKQFVSKKNKHVEQIKQRYLLKVTSLNKEEWYVITEESDSLNDSNIKNVTAYSLGYQLADKHLRDWPGVKIDDEYRKESLSASQILNDLLSNSSWSLDTLSIDTVFLTRYRAFDFSNTTVLDAVFNVAEKFNAIISWDTHSKLIKLHDAEKYGAFRGLMLSDNHYLKSYEKVTKSDEMATRLKLYGYDDLSINEVNPTGTEFIEDFSFFIRGFEMDANKNVLSSSPYMSDALCIAIINYQKLIETNSSQFTFFLTQKEGLEAQYTTRENELFILEDELFAIQTSIDYKESLKINASAEKNQERIKKAEITTKKNQLSNLLISIEDINRQIIVLKALLSMNENFTKAQLMELDNYIIEKTWTNENISDAKELLELGIKELEKLNKPKVVYNLSLVYLLKIAEAERLATKLRLGDKIRVVKKEINEIVESQAIEIQIDYESQDINLTITDSTITNDEDALVNMLYKSMSSSAVIELNKNKWNDISRVGNLIGDVLESKWDAAKREILAGANESVVINNRGITLMDSNNPDRFVRLTHGVIGMTDDGGNNFNLAIDSSGVYAERLVGRIIAGQHLYMENTEGTFRFDQDGVTIQGSAFRVLAADNTNLIDSWNNAEANAKAYSDSMKLQIQSEIDDIHTTLDNFGDDVFEAFADGIISETESISIGNYKNTLNTEKTDIDSRFIVIYNDPQLTNPTKSQLNTKKLAYNTAHTNLINSIEDAIEDKKTTEIEKQNVDAKFISYRTSLSELSVAFENAINVIAQAKATAAQQNAMSYAQTQVGLINNDINDITTRVDGLNDFTNAAFKDGIVDFAEKEALRSHIEQLNTEKADLDVRYTSIYNDTNLTGTPKTTLNSLKTSYNSAHTTLLSSIGTAISDNVITDSEKATVTTNFATYRTALSNLSTAFETAVRSIESAKATTAQQNAINASIGIGQTINGVKIDTAGLTVTRGDDKVEARFNATEGILIRTKKGANWTDAFKYDIENERLVVDGEINARELKVNGETVLANGGKIKAAAIEHLEVGMNVTMGANAVISWSQFDNSTKETIAANQMNWLGSFSVYPITPKRNDAFYHIVDGKSYIYSGTIWTILAQDGSDGTDGGGSSGIVAVLSNDSHVLAANSSGSVISFAGCATTVYVYEGITDVSSSWTATVTATALTYTTSGKTFTVTNMSADTGYLDIRLTRSGYSAITKRFTVTKVRDGANGTNGTSGQDATSYWLVNSVPAIAKNISGVYTPSTITVTGKSQTGTNSPTNYSGRFIIATSTDGSSYTTRYTSSSNQTSTTYSVSIANLKTIRVQMYLAGGTSTLLDEQIIPIVSDGATGAKGATGDPGQYYAPSYLNATSIDFGAVTSPNLVGNTIVGSTGQVGLTSYDSGNTAVRFWAGTTYANRYSAPFRVTQDGTVTMTKANIETNTVNSMYVKLSGSMIQGGNFSYGESYLIGTAQLAGGYRAGLVQLDSYSSETSSSRIRRTQIAANAIMVSGSNLLLGGASEDRSVVVSRRVVLSDFDYVRSESLIVVGGAYVMGNISCFSINATNMNGIENALYTFIPTDSFYATSFQKRGMVYYDNSLSALRVFNGSTWQTVYAY